MQASLQARVPPSNPWFMQFSPPRSGSSHISPPPITPSPQQPEVSKLPQLASQARPSPEYPSNAHVCPRRSLPSHTSAPSALPLPHWKKIQPDSSKEQSAPHANRPSSNPRDEQLSPFKSVASHASPSSTLPFPHTAAAPPDESSAERPSPEELSLVGPILVDAPEEAASPTGVSAEVAVVSGSRAFVVVSDTTVFVVPKSSAGNGGASPTHPLPASIRSITQGTSQLR